MDSSLIDTSLEFDEAEADLKQKYPHQMTETVKKGDILSVNTYMHLLDLTDTEPMCLYCGKTFERERSTRKYCKPSHRVLMHRRNRKQAV